MSMKYLKSDEINYTGCNGEVAIVNLRGWKAHSDVLLNNSCSIDTTIGLKTHANTADKFW